MPKMFGGDPPLGDYAPVADRITAFYERHPEGRIITSLRARSDEEIVFVAKVYRGSGDRRPAATGWAAERPGDGDINAVACLENTETSAVGRALANLGFTASKRRPSREEMEKAGRVRARLRTSAVAASLSHHRAAPPARDFLNSATQALADGVTDLLSLVRAARRWGLRDYRAQRIETWLRAGDPTPELLDRLGRRLRRWIAFSVERQLHEWSVPHGP